MTSGHVWPLLAAAVLVVVAGLFTAADAALASFSRARAAELVTEGRGGAKRLVAVLDDAPRYLNTALLLELLCEIAAIVLVTVEVADLVDGPGWVSGLVTIGVMLLVSFVVIGVAPRTLGRQHSEAVALVSAAPLAGFTAVLGPLPRLLILLGNAITPGRGFREGPFSTETELREMVDIAEASALIESGERKMIHSVFELGDTTVREVMVPRNDVVYIEHFKNLRQTLSLFLRSGYSRVPVIGENLDDVRGIAYLKDVVRRDFEAPEVELTQRVEEVMRPVSWVPESKPVDAQLSEMQANRQHIAVVVDEYGGTAGLITIEDLLEEIVGEITDEYDEDEIETEALDDGPLPTWRVSSRYPIDDLEELFGFDVEEEDVDSVGGLMAKHLGRVPIPGSYVEAHGLRFEAEDASGRRNKVGTVLIRRTAPAEGDAEDLAPADLNRLLVMELSAEDNKLVTLARATRARTRAAEGAALRDADGRTYAAATVDLASLQVSALQVCVAMAVASGSRGIAAAVLLGDAAELREADRAPLAELGGPDVVVHLGDSRGVIAATTAV